MKSHIVETPELVVRACNTAVIRNVQVYFQNSETEREPMMVSVLYELLGTKNENSLWVVNCPVEDIHRICSDLGYFGKLFVEPKELVGVRCRLYLDGKGEPWYHSTIS